MPRRKIEYANSLQAEFPHIAKQWDLKENSPLTPAGVNSGSHKKVWWKCNKGPDHQWRTTVKNRTMAGSGCPCCANKQVSVTNSLETQFPNVASQWDYVKNEDTPSDIIAGSNKKRWWRCDQGPDHHWEAVVDSRTRGGVGCPFCVGQRVSVTNSLAALFPEVAAQWDYEKNDNTPSDVVAGANKKASWKCDNGPDHRWEAVISSRTSGERRGCPFCANKKASVTNSLAALFPEVAAQWDYENNGNITPSGIVAGSSTKRRWWKCDKGPDHQWLATPQSRTRQGSGCPFCDNKKVSVTNSLATLFPKIADEWHPDKNGKRKSTNIVAGSEEQIWWQCKRNSEHSWRTTPSHRTQRGQGCPRCYSRQSEPEIVLACELEQFFRIDHNERCVIDSKNRSWEVDIIIHSEKLLIEYDGAYFHEGRENEDRAKTEALSSSGWCVVRIREKGLRPIQPHDLIIEQPYGSSENAKKHMLKDMVNSVLQHLQHVLGRNITGMPNYLVQSDLANYDQALSIMSQHKDDDDKLDDIHGSGAQLEMRLETSSGDCPNVIRIH